MDGTRQDIVELLSKQELTAQELAERLHITPAGVRQHLAQLEALGWVRHEKEVQGAHRPSFRYQVTDAGRGTFPKRYELMLDGLLSELTARQGDQQALWMVRNAARRLADRERDRLAAGDAAGRWPRVVAWLESELRWRAEEEIGEGGVRRLTIHRCPFQAISAAYPDVCGAFCVTLVGELAGKPGAPVGGRHIPGGQGPSCCALEMEAGAAG